MNCTLGFVYQAGDEETFEIDLGVDPQILEASFDAVGALSIKFSV